MKYKRYIPEEACIQICMWRNENPNFNINNWEERKKDDSSMETGAGSIHGAMKIVKQGLDNGYTHFTLKYPIAMHGNTINEPTGGK